MEESEVQRAVSLIARHFPGADLAMDTTDRWMIEHQDRYDAMRVVSARMRWACDDPADVERWGLGLPGRGGGRGGEQPEDDNGTDQRGGLGDSCADDSQENSAQQARGHTCCPGAGGIDGGEQQYLDVLVPPADKEAIVKAGATVGYIVEIKDKEYADFMTAREKPWEFISHDSRDKDDFVRPLARKLQSMLCPVWYDEYSLNVGDRARVHRSRTRRSAEVHRRSVPELLE